MIFLLNILLMVLQLSTREKMVLIWRERELESHDLDASNDETTIQALRNCGLLKFF